MKRIVLSILPFLIAVNTCFAQKKQFKTDTTLAGKWFTEAALLQEKGKYDSAKVVFTKAGMLYKKHHLWTKLSDCSTKISQGYVLKGEYEQALQLARQTLAESKARLGEHHVKVADVYHTTGVIYFYKGESDHALKYFKQALTIRLSILGVAHPQVGECYNNMGVIYMYKGEYEKALEYYNKDLEISLKAFGESNPKLAASYNNVGLMYYYKSDYEKALDYYQKALDIRLNRLGKEHTSVATSYNNIGSLYDEIGEYDKAIGYYHKSLNIWIKALGESHPRVADCYSNLGSAYQNKGEYERALAYYRKDLQGSLKVYGRSHPRLATTYNSMGIVYENQHAYTKALEHYQKAIVANTPSFTDTLTFRNPVLALQATSYFDGLTFLSSLQSKGEVLNKRFEKTQSKADLILAYQTYCSLDTLSWQLLDTYTEETDKLTFTTKFRDIYQSALRVALRLHQETGEQRYVDKAFYFAERGKAGVLASTLADSKAKQFSGIADSLLSLDEQLRSEIAEYKQLLAQEYANGMEADSSKLQQYQNSLFSAHRKQEKLIEDLERQYPRYHQLKYQSSLVTPSQLQSVLDPQTALIEYVVSDSLLQVFTITRQSYQVHSVSLDSLFVRRLSAFRQAILSGDEDLYGQTAYPLYKTLLSRSLPKSIKELILIPEGELTSLPFEALLTSADEKKGKGYLLEKYGVSYAYSASLLYERLQQKQTKQAKQLLALAPVFEDSASNVLVASNRDLLSKQQAQEEKDPVLQAASSKLAARGKPAATDKSLAMRGWLLDGQYVSPLLASKGEVETITSLFAQKGHKTNLYLHGEAGEDKLKSKAMAASSYIHIATHGFVNEQYPELSGLLFAQDSSMEEDGILYTGEIYSLALQAELVTLSACETGLGKLAKGEGIIGLTRALLYAGAKNVVVSFWKVPDNSTALLMGYFYKAIMEGNSKTAALQQAKVKMLEGTDYRHPFFWAPFILVGK